QIDSATHQPGPFGTPAVSKFVIQSGFVGVLPLNFQFFLIPQIRDLFLGVDISIGETNLSGLPVDFAFDDMRSLSGLPNITTAFSAGSGAPLNGKQLVRVGCPFTRNNSTPRYMFVAVPNPTVGSGVVDVLRVDGNYVRVDTNAFHSGIQS